MGAVEGTEAPAGGDRDQLNPAQRRVVEELRRPGVVRPEFDPELAAALAAELEAGLAPVAERVGDRGRVVVHKRLLTDALGCETRFVHDDAQPFEWTVPAARGVVAHKAIELSVNLAPGTTPGELTDRALERLRDTDDDRGPSAWLRGLDPGELAELRSEVCDVVTMFLECWPPLPRSWKPNPEARIRAELCDGRVTLQGKVDLALGAPNGRRAGKLLVDLKTGRPAPHHLDDLRFYALVETLRLGVPPFRVAAYYLEAAGCRAEDVEEAALWAAVHRTIAGTERAVALRLGDREPGLTPGPACGWCALAADCEGARRWEDERPGRSA